MQPKKKDLISLLKSFDYLGDDKKLLIAGS